MGIGAGISILAVAVHDDVPAHLSLLHFLYFLVELHSVFSVDELLLLSLSGSLTAAGATVTEYIL